MADIPKVESPRSVYVYIVAISAAALLLLLAALGSPPSRPAPIEMPTLLLVGILVVVSVLAQRSPLHLTYQTKVDVDMAVLIAAVLLLDVPTVIATVAVAIALYQVTNGGSWRACWDEWVFNVA